jgi:hypothetical protein
MNIDIKSEDVLDKVKERLGHLVACRDFLDAFLKCGLDKKLIEKQAKSEYAHERGAFEKELKEYRDAYQHHAMQLDMGSRSSTIDQWLVDVEHLERAEHLVTTTIYLAVGGGYNDLPNDKPYKFHDWIRSLTKFDDSE